MQNYNLKNQIWQVVDSRSYGGIESHIFYLASALAEKKCNVCVVFIHDYGPHPLERKLQDKGISMIKCAGALDFIKRVKKLKPRLIHSHGYKANLSSRLAGKLYNIPVISSFHAGDCETLRLKLYTVLDRKTAFLNTPIAVNELIAGTLTGSPKVIDNFVPLPPRYKVVKRIENIGFVGRLSHEKGPDRFIDLAGYFPSLTFHVFGSGPMEEDLKHAAPENVKFHGHVESMESAWKDMDILCMPSRKEGLPMAALEGMAAGVPVLAYSAGALPKLITHGENGWLAPLPEDAQICAQDLKEILCSLSVSQAKYCSIDARRVVQEEYSQQALVPVFLKLYDDVASPPDIKTESRAYAAF